MGLKEKKIITISNAAGLCNVSRATIWRWIKIGELKAAKTAGGHYRILKQDLQTFIRQKEMRPRFRNPEIRKRILLVDNDPEIIKLFKRILSRSAYQLACAADGFDAGIKIMGFKPDLVILDLSLPNMNGVEVCRQLRDNRDTQHIKIVAITGYDTLKNKKAILASGADTFLPKPLDNDRVLREIHCQLYQFDTNGTNSDG